MKKLKRMLCVAMAAVVLACVSVTAFAQETSSAEINFDSAVSTFYRGFAAVRHCIGDKLGFNEIEKSCEPEFKVPALDEGFIPQGLCYVSTLGSFAVCGYTDDGTASILCVVDQKSVYFFRERSRNACSPDNVFRFALFLVSFLVSLVLFAS